MAHETRRAWTFREIAALRRRAVGDDGTDEGFAAAVGCSVRQARRWRKGQSRPSRMAKQALDALHARTPAR